MWVDPNSRWYHFSLDQPVRPIQAFNYGAVFELIPIFTLLGFKYEVQRGLATD